MSADALAQVQRFNRMVLQRFGMLNEEFSTGGRSLIEQCLLSEIGVNGADVVALSSRLETSEDYIGQVLQGLQGSGVVDLDHSASDGQIDTARLTAAGLVELHDQDRRSEAAAHAVLTALNPAQRLRLLESMWKTERLLLSSAIVVRVADPYHPDLEVCLRTYFAELVGRYGEFDPNLSRPLTREELMPPDGLLLMAYDHDRPVACGALRFLPNGVAAIKRMWVSIDHRGLGIGARILDELENHARANDVQFLRLETKNELHEAIRLYEQFGYREVAPFNDEFYADRWYEKALAEKPSAVAATSRTPRE